MALTDNSVKINNNRKRKISSAKDSWRSKRARRSDTLDRTKEKTYNIVEQVRKCQFNSKIRPHIYTTDIENTHSKKQMRLLRLHTSTRSQCSRHASKTCKVRHGHE
mgnify:FL=1